MKFISVKSRSIQCFKSKTMIFQIWPAEDFITLPWLSSLMASATKRRENLLHSSWLVPRAQTLISAVERSSLISKARNIMRQLNSITNRFQSSIPQTRYQKKKKENSQQKFIASVFTDVLHRRKWVWSLICQRFCNETILRAFWRGLKEQLVTREPSVWDFQGLRNNGIPSNSIPH